MTKERFERFFLYGLVTLAFATVMFMVAPKANALPLGVIAVEQLEPDKIAKVPYIAPELDVATANDNQSFVLPEPNSDPTGMSSDKSKSLVAASSETVSGFTPDVKFHSRL